MGASSLAKQWLREERYQAPRQNVIADGLVTSSARLRLPTELRAIRGAFHNSYRDPNFRPRLAVSLQLIRLRTKKPFFTFCTV